MKKILLFSMIVLSAVAIQKNNAYANTSDKTYSYQYPYPLIASIQIVYLKTNEWSFNCQNNVNEINTSTAKNQLIACPLSKKEFNHFFEKSSKKYSVTLADSVDAILANNEPVYLGSESYHLMKYPKDKPDYNFSHAYSFIFSLEKDGFDMNFHMLNSRDAKSAHGHINNEDIKEKKYWITASSTGNGTVAVALLNFVEYPL